MRKLMWFTIGFTAATLLGCGWLGGDSFLLAAGAAAVGLAVCLVLMLRFPQFRVPGMVIFGCILGFLWQLGYESFYLSTARENDQSKAVFTIYATDYSYETDYGCAVEGKFSLDGKTYKIRAYLPKETSLSPGDSVTGEFTVRSTLPGCSKESEYYRSDGTFLIAYPGKELTVTQAEKLPLYGYAAYIRQSLTTRIGEIFPADVSGFAKALLLGDTDDIDYETDTAFKLSGIRHVIAVSGLHVTILFSLVYVFTGRRRWLTAMLGIPVLIFFAAVAGFSPSITRACIMHILMVIAMLFEREYDPPTALSFSVLVMLVVNPWTVTNVGFQLSVSCMVGIFLFATPMQNWLFETKGLGKMKGIRGMVTRWVCTTVCISISAGIFTTPLCAYYFGVVSLVSLITNVLTLWVISFIFYGIMLALLLSWIFLPAGTVVALVIAWPIRFVLWSAKTLASFPLAAVYTESIYIVFWLIFCYMLLAAFLLMRHKHPFLLGCCAALGLCVALMASWLEPARDDFRMTVLDVGQGQCILLQCDGRHYLVDCGGDSDTQAADKAAALLLSQGISRLDGLIITHFDADHAAGAIYLLQRIDTDILYLPTCADEEGIGQMLQSSTDSFRMFVEQDVEISVGEGEITLIPSENAETDNESGLCVLFQRENCDILITGDRSAKGERELLEHRTLPELEVLIVGHHGSKYSTSRELLIKTSPEIAVISVGEDNSYGHPAQDVLDRLEQFGCIVYRTDRDGTVIYRG